MGKFVPNPRFLEEIAADGELDAIMEEGGHVVLGVAQGLSEEFRETGAWQEHLTGELKHSGVWPYYRVQDNRDASEYIEFGTSKTAAKRALGRAIRQAEI